MPYRRTENVVRRLAARHDAIVAAAAALAAEGGINAVQISPVSQRAGVATGTVYRYFPSKTELVAALAAAITEREIAAMRGAANAAPGPLSALAAALATFAARAMAERKLAFALIAEPVDAAADAARLAFRTALARETGEPPLRRDAGRPPARSGHRGRDARAGRRADRRADRPARDCTGQRREDARRRAGADAVRAARGGRGGCKGAGAGGGDEVGGAGVIRGTQAPR